MSNKTYTLTITVLIKQAGSLTTEFSQLSREDGNKMMNMIRKSGSSFNLVHGDKNLYVQDCLTKEFTLTPNNN